MTTNLTPEDVLPEHPEEPITRSMLIEAYNASGPQTEYSNHGDATPEHYGGVWCRWEPSSDMWRVFTTQPATELIGVEDIREELGKQVDFDDPGHQWVRMVHIYADDLIGESGQWEGDFSRYMDELNRAHHTPAGAVVDGKLTDYVAGFADSHFENRVARIRDLTHELPHGFVLREDYESVLDYLGVEPEEGEL